MTTALGVVFLVGAAGSFGFGQTQGTVTALRDSQPGKCSAADDPDADRLFLRGCNIDAAPPANGDVDAACRSIGYRRSEKEGFAVQLLAPRGSTASGNKRRAALCVTGQLRTLPATLPSWEASLFPALQAGGLALDIFVVTSSSQSLAIGLPLVVSLQPSAVAVASDFRFVNGSSDDWGHREEEVPTEFSGALRAAGVASTLSVTFNLRGFPFDRAFDEADKYDSYLVQHWQMEKCSNMLEAAEAQGGFKYARVARMRPDFLFFQGSEGLLQCFQQEQFEAGTTVEAQAQATCLEQRAPPPAATTRPFGEGGGVFPILPGGRGRRLRPLLEPAGDGAGQSEQWLHKFGIDLGLLGSRDLVVDKAFSGLRWLHEHRGWRGTPIDFNPGRWPGCFRDPPEEPSDCNGYLPLENASSGFGEFGNGELRAAVFQLDGHGELLRVAASHLHAGAPEPAATGGGWDIFCPWAFATANDRSQTLVEHNPALLEARNAPDAQRRRAETDVLYNQMGYTSSSALASPCTLEVGGQEVAMDVFSGLPRHWAAALRRALFPAASALQGCLGWSLCVGAAEAATYGDDFAGPHEDVFSGGSTFGGTDDLGERNYEK
jgi:hypothetical protein